MTTEVPPGKSVRRSDVRDTCTLSPECRSRARPLNNLAVDLAVDFPESFSGDLRPISIRMMRRVLKYLAVFLIWNLAVGFVLLLNRPVIGLITALVLYALLLQRYLLRAPREGEPDRIGDLRLAPLTGTRLRWVFAATPIVLLLSWAIGDLYTRLLPVPESSLNPFGDILTDSGGRLLIAVFAIGIAPIVEEFFFRGLIQRELERRLGTAAGIAGAAALFALVHLLPWVFPLHFFLGVVFGFAVWVTRSIWAGVLLHTANNIAALVGISLVGDEPAPTGTLLEQGLTADLGLSLAVLAVSAGIAAWMVRRSMELRT